MVRVIPFSVVKSHKKEGAHTNVMAVCVFEPEPWSNATDCSSKKLRGLPIAPLPRCGGPLTQSALDREIHFCRVFEGRRDPSPLLNLA